MSDQFFDCLNVRNLEKQQKKTQLFLKPYINENYGRFSWMANLFFFSYPSTWEKILKIDQVISLKMLDLKSLSVCKLILAYKSLKAVNFFTSKWLKNILAFKGNQGEEMTTLVWRNLVTITIKLESTEVFIKFTGYKEIHRRCSRTENSAN